MKSNMNDIDKLVEALRAIRKAAMEHPCFSPIIYASRDYARLEDVGGDIAAWTQIAITADEALDAVGKGEL